MTGASYMGISQLFAGGRHPEGLKAIFPQVPAADVHRDVAASGGQIDVEIFPTAAKIKKGHRLRITIQGYDVPHLLPPVTDLAGQSLPTTIHTGKGTNSRLILPVS